MNQSERDRLIETVLESIHLGYEKLEKIDQELEEVRKIRGIGQRSGGKIND